MSPGSGRPIRADRDLPLDLAGRHRTMEPGARLRVSVTIPDDRGDNQPLWRWDGDHLALVVHRAGFDDVRVDGDATEGPLAVTARRAVALPDFTASDLRVLLVGLNPSWHAANAGFGFAGPGNRFWPTALASGLISRARDPHHAVLHHRVGFTDLVKRPTARAAEIPAAEFRAGAQVLASLVRWLSPGVVCVVGLTGWRTVGHRGAKAGWQAEPFGGRPVYVMPNPSGLNAATPASAFVDHFRAVQSGAPE